jgi:hypothetical protein
MLCPPGQRYEHITTNGTDYVVCVEDTSGPNIGLIIVLSLISTIALLVSFLLCLKLFTTFYDTWKQKKELVDSLHCPENSRMLRRWEAFINDGGYIRRIAQLLEFEENIPHDLGDYFAENYPDLWKKVNQDDFYFVMRCANLIKVLFEEQAKLEKRTINETIASWEDKLVDKCGGEFAQIIMTNVKHL